MKWYTFIEKMPKINESILICISGVNRAKDNNAPVLNPTYQCVFAGTYNSVVFLQNLILISEKFSPIKRTSGDCSCKLSNYVTLPMDPYNFHWARLE